MNEGAAFAEKYSSKGALVDANLLPVYLFGQTSFDWHFHFKQKTMHGSLENRHCPKNTATQLDWRRSTSSVTF